MARYYLGCEPNLGGYRRVFEIEGALEVEENNFTQIERTRVYFDDVLAVTHHKELGWGYLVVLGIASLLLVFGLMMTAMDSDVRPAGVVLIVLGSPFAIALVLRLILKVDVITVYGRRTKASMKFSIRKGFARELYTTLAAKIRHRQEQSLAAQPRPAAPPPAEPPPPPPPA